MGSKMSTEKPKEAEIKGEKCKDCGRDEADTAKQEASGSGLLPYRKCGTCKIRMYYKPDTEYVEYDEAEGGIVLISDCFCGDWDAALERVRLYPKEAATVPEDYKAESALHWACYGGAPAHVIKEIAAAGPEMATFQPGWHEQGLPLDCLMAFRFPYIKPDLMDKVKAILEVNVEVGVLSALTAWQKIGGAAKKALKLYPNGFPEDGPFGHIEDDRDEKQRKNTPLTIAQQLQLMWDVFSLLNKASYYKTLDCTELPLLPALADCRSYYRDSDGMNWQQCPDDALKFAVKMYPEELMKQDKDGNLPLHLAIQRTQPVCEKEDWEEEEMDEFEPPAETVYEPYDTYNVSKIEILVKASPETAQVRNMDGQLPLHAVIQVRKSWAGVEAVLNAWPDAIKEVDRHGNTCLHLVAWSALPTIYKEEWNYPASVDDDDDDDSDAEDLYYTLKSRINVKVLERLLTLYPTALETPNHRALLPLHLAIKSSKAWEEGIETLFAACPETVRAVEGETGLYPFMLAAVHSPENLDQHEAVDVIFRLLREWPDALKKSPSQSVENVGNHQVDTEEPSNNKKRKL